MKYPVFFFILGLLSINHTLFSQNMHLPNNATVGKCYQRCIQPEKFETITQQVLVKEAEKKIVVEPAVYDTVYQEILEKEGYVVLEVIPAEYTTADIEVVIEPSSIEYGYVPPVFEIQEEYVVLEPARTEWKRKIADRGCFDQRNIEDCVVWCLEIIPPRLDTLREEIVKEHAHPKEVFVPAKVKKITQTMVLSPASLKRRVVPPIYRTVKTLKLVSPAKTTEIEIPAEYQTIAVRKKIKASGFSDWVEINCPQIESIEGK